MAPARVSSSRATASERLVLIPAIDKRNTTGYKNVTYNRSSKKFVAKVTDGGESVHFDTAEEAATAYARSKYGRADAAKLRQPRPAPTAAGAEAVRQAEREGLTLATSSSSSSGYRGVVYCPSQHGRGKKYQLMVSVGGKQVYLGMFATAEQAALFYARREAGRDTSDLTAPPPPPPPPVPSSAAGAEVVRQAEREGLTLATSSSNTGYKGVYHCPGVRGSKKYQLQVRSGGKLAGLGYFATAEEAALFYARRQAGRLAGSGALEGAESETETEGEEEEGEEPAVHRPAAPRPSGAASKRRSPGQASAAGPSRVSQQPDPDAVFGAPPPPQVLARRPSRAALLPPPDLSLPPPPPSSLQAPPPRITFDEKVIVEAERRLWIDPCGNLGARAHAAYIALL
ncbi:hypothetical protein EMIHUDRAFT_118445 [Emiliania huxleyi CCMP1516]|uniref:AP2/ERF domain-containing protein n=2 Tax=Emiliania huxleyi TaxID=2903 RepID=A0A0D3J2E8_EMIH1|nr:hypothetical protein EMIHUDRAFT_118445 [Emiliania huxleyi CCMP1516]EOD17683.1 hypothetical protein EMIHUDRAFT_118445 [Emiliania huxleyi CCMP1516]|eukprot:XP_005770112.1 hypothetical protein EMIHUDRAFT_118445 [Emiliania huxleyi CCMP1516]